MSKKSAIQVEVVDENLLKMLLDKIASLELRIVTLETQTQNVINMTVINND